MPPRLHPPPPRPRPLPLTRLTQPQRGRLDRRPSPLITYPVPQTHHHHAGADDAFVGKPKRVDGVVVVERTLGVGVGGELADGGVAVG